MKGKRINTERRTGGDRRKFSYKVTGYEKRQKIRRLVPDRRNLVKQTRQML